MMLERPVCYLHSYIHVSNETKAKQNNAHRHIHTQNNKTKRKTVVTLYSAYSLRNKAERL